MSSNANGEFVLRHVHVHVPDVSSLADWYKSHFGLEEIYRFEDKLTILGNAGDCQIGFEAGEAVGHPERIHLIFRVPDVDEWHGKLRGELEIGEPVDQPYGHRVMWMQDPVGHTIELYTPLDGDRAYD